MENNKQRFSIRKISVGAVSVLLGLTFLGAYGSRTVSAATPDSKISQNKSEVTQSSSVADNGIDSESNNQKSNTQDMISTNNEKEQTVQVNNLETPPISSSALAEKKDVDVQAKSSANKVPVAQADINNLKDKDGNLYNNATAQNQIIIYTEPTKGLTAVNANKGQYKFEDGMQIVGRVYSGYYKGVKGVSDGVYDDHNANSSKVSRDELVEKDTTGDGLLTLNLADIAPDYSNYEFDLDFSKQFDANRTSMFNKGTEGNQIQMDFNKVVKSPQLKNTTYQLFIKPKDSATLQLKALHDHSNETLINWYDNHQDKPGEHEHDKYLGTSVVDDYSMGVGDYVNGPLRSNHPNISIDTKPTQYEFDLSNSNGWKFEVNGANDATYGTNGFMPVTDGTHQKAIFSFSKLPSNRLSVNRGYLDPVTDSTDQIPEARAVSGYTNPNEIPLFIELGNGNKITKILKLTGKPGETISVKDRVILPEGSIFEPTAKQLPDTYTFSKDGRDYYYTSEHPTNAVLQTTIRDTNVRYLSNNPKFVPDQKDFSSSTAIFSNYPWGTNYAKNIQDYLQNHPITKTVTETIYVNNKQVAKLSKKLERTITFDNSHGKNAIYENPNDPTIARAFGPWENEQFSPVNYFDDYTVQNLPKNATFNSDNGQISKDGKLTNVSLFDENGNPKDVSVHITTTADPTAKQNISKQVSRNVYKQQDGKKTLVTTQNVTVTGTETVDTVTHEVLSTKWNSASFESISVPTIEKGYHVTNPDAGKSVTVAISNDQPQNGEDVVFEIVSNGSKSTVENKQVTRDIYIQLGNESVTKVDTQSVNLNREVTTDNYTHQSTYGAWKVANGGKAEFATYNAPVEHGYQVTNSEAGKAANIDLSNPENGTKVVFVYKIVKAVGQNVVATVGQDVSATEAIANMDTLPDNTKVTWTKEPNVSKASNRVEATVSVIYPDGTKKLLNVNVNVEPNNKYYETVVLNSNSKVSCNVGEILDAKSAVLASDQLPIGTKFNWVNVPDASSAGTKDEEVTITYPDGTKTNVKVKVVVSEAYVPDYTGDSNETKVKNNDNQGKLTNNEKVLDNIEGEMVQKTIKHASYIYDDQGHRVGKIVISAYKSINVYKTVKIINGKKYYKIGPRRYIKAANVDGKLRKLTHNAFVYSHKGKRISRVLLKKGHYVRTYGASAKLHKHELGGRKYYKIGKDKYVKVINFK